MTKLEDIIHRAEEVEHQGEQYTIIKPKEDNETSLANLYKLYTKDSFLNEDQVQIAEKQEKVITKIDMHEETENIAELGDYIVTRKANDQYVVKSADFDNLYKKEGKKYIAKSTVFGLQINDMNFALDASFGRQYMKSGSYIVYNLNTKEFYCVAQQAFEQDYKILDSQRSIVDASVERCRNPNMRNG